MSDINIYTYEIYLLDFYEGVLSKRLENELRLFAKKHPEIDIDFDENPINFHLTPEKEIFVHKGALLQNEHVDRFDHLVIAEMENIITEEENAEKENLLQQFPYLKLEEERTKMTVLSPDLSLVFTNKTQLIQKPGLSRKLIVYWSGVAASVVAILMVFMLNQKPQYKAVKIAKNTIVNQAKESFSHSKKAEVIKLKKQQNKVFQTKNNPTVDAQNKPIKVEKIESNGEIQKMRTETLTAFKVQTPTLEIPQKTLNSKDFSATMAMTDEKLDLMMPAEIMEQFFGISSDSTTKEKKGFTFRIGKLIIFQFGKNKDKNNKE